MIFTKINKQIRYVKYENQCFYYIRMYKACSMSRSEIIVVLNPIRLRMAKTP